MGACVDWERARKPEQKAFRREEILNAAKALFAELDYEEISLNGIAREAGFSKPNVYRYFATREEIFLAIYEEEQGKFVQSFISRLKRIRAKEPVDAIARAWVDVALDHRAWLELLPQAAMSMERNSSVAQIVEFKKVGYQRYGMLIDALESTHPGLSKEQWATVAQCAYAMMAGLWPIANPGDNVLEALRHPDVAQTPWDFKASLERGISALIRGTEAMKGK